MFGAFAEEQKGEEGSDFTDKRYVEQVVFLFLFLFLLLLFFFFQRSSPSIGKRPHTMAVLKKTGTFKFNNLIGSRMVFVRISTDSFSCCHLADYVNEMQ